MQQSITQQAIKILNEAKQSQLTATLLELQVADKDKLATQILNLDKTCPGGLAGYCQRARKYLYNSKNNINPYQGFTPYVPQGYVIDNQNGSYSQIQKLGIQALPATTFVLVAGGLGQRLGYKGIKIELPVELMTQTCFLQYYISYLRQYQRRFFTNKIQLTIMTSDDTHNRTIKLLQQNNYFGMQKQQINLIKQQKVPALINNDACFAFDLKNKLIQTKPHGHGDVHTLLYQYGLADRWVQNGIKWIIFFQDTNPIIFKSILLALGVSRLNELKINSVAVPRKPGQAVGAIMKLKKQSQQMTINVQYNQLQSLLSNFGGEVKNEQGYSLYPGNINVLIFDLTFYTKILNGTIGVIQELINPKYKEKDKKQFKSPARLQCMMQDFPKLLQSSKGVAFTQMNRNYCFTAVKNDIKTAQAKFQQNLPPQCAISCQADFYQLNRKFLKPKFKFNQEKLAIGKMPFTLYPRVYISPKFGITYQQIQKQISGQCQMVGQSDLIILDNVPIQNLKILKGQRIIVTSKGIQRIAAPKLIQAQVSDKEIYAMRGYKQTILH